MTKIEFNHDNLGINLYVNGQSYGKFPNEKEASYYLILNKLIDTIILDRNTKCRRES